MAVIASGAADDDGELRIAQILVSKGVITEDQLRQALEVQHSAPANLFKIITDLGFASEEIISRARTIILGGEKLHTLDSFLSTGSSLSARTINGKTRVLAVWGHPVSHSRSPAMQNAALEALGLDWVYVPFDVAPERLKDAVAGMRALGLVGVNCTVPLKEQVGQYLDSIDQSAERIGSVNTIVNNDGRLTGYSTDGAGFLWDLDRQGLHPDGKRVLIWGSGGSSRAIACALAERGCKIVIANRTVERAREVAQLAGADATGTSGGEYEAALSEANLLINTTTLGMNGNGMPPLPDDYPRPEQSVYDIVYAPPLTPLLQRAYAQGCHAVNGLGMLACQGALSLSLWMGKPAQEMPLNVMLRALESE